MLKEYYFRKNENSVTGTTYKVNGHKVSVNVFFALLTKTALTHKMEYRSSNTYETPEGYYDISTCQNRILKEIK